jgi:hypothetical protein
MDSQRFLFLRVQRRILLIDLGRQEARGGDLCSTGRC